MQKTLERIGTEFESSSQKTPEFTSYARTFESEIKKEIEKVGGTLESFNQGHFYVSGFFKVAGQMYYFSQSDVRHFPSATLLLRTAQHIKDYTGGSNHYVTMGKDMFIDNLPR